jgi:hypothetical protein
MTETQDAIEFIKSKLSAKDKEKIAVSEGENGIITVQLFAKLNPNKTPKSAAEFKKTGTHAPERNFINELDEESTGLFNKISNIVAKIVPFPNYKGEGENKVYSKDAIHTQIVTAQYPEENIFIVKKIDPEFIDKEKLTKLEYVPFALDTLQRREFRSALLAAVPGESTNKGDVVEEKYEAAQARAIVYRNIVGPILKTMGLQNVEWEVTITPLVGGELAGGFHVDIGQIKTAYTCGRFCPCHLCYPLCPALCFVSWRCKNSTGKAGQCAICLMPAVGFDGNLHIGTAYWTLRL